MARLLHAPNPSAARWTESLKRLPALSVRQPYAWLIVAGVKDIENRTRRTHYRGPVLIHAALTSKELSDANLAQMRVLTRFDIDEDALRFGGIVGVVDVVDCVEASRSKWKMENHWGWVLENPRVLPFRACRGALGMFRPKF